MKTRLLAIALVLALAGCGGTDRMSERDRVRATIGQYYHAVSFGDGETACRFLTAQARHALPGLLKGAAARDCEANVRKLARVSLPLHATSVSGIAINGDHATAYVTSGQPPYSNTVELTREGGSWKLLYVPTALPRAENPRVAGPGHGLH
jgi:hypothetical protein